MTAGPNHILADAGPFGPWGSGHSHSDTLSVVARADGEEILIDAGTYTYAGGARDWFRGSSAHNTIRIGKRDQAAPASAFGWTGQPEVRIRTWTTSEARDFLDADCRYAGFVHRRRILFIKPDLLLIVDDIDGPPGEYSLEQFWHSGAAVMGLGAGLVPARRPECAVPRWQRGGGRGRRERLAIEGVRAASAGPRDPRIAPRCSAVAFCGRPGLERPGRPSYSSADRGIPLAHGRLGANFEDAGKQRNTPCFVSEAGLFGWHNRMPY